MPTTRVFGKSNLCGLMKDQSPRWDEIGFDVTCPQCGYCLRGLPEPRCPECAAEFSWEERILSCGTRTRGSPSVSLANLTGSFWPNRFWKGPRTVEPARSLPLFLLLLSAPFLFILCCLALDWLTVQVLRAEITRGLLLALVGRWTTAKALWTRLDVLAETGVLRRADLRSAASQFALLVLSMWALLAAQIPKGGRLGEPLRTALSVVAFVAQPLAVGLALELFLGLGVLGLAEIVGIRAFGFVVVSGIFIAAPGLLTLCLFPAAKRFLLLSGPLVRCAFVAYVSVVGAILIYGLASLE